MLGQLNLAGKTREEVAIERIRSWEPPDGYYLAFSGGKDSIVIKHLADRAGVKYDAHYNVTSVDPPELIRFIREYHPDVQFDYPRYPDGSRLTMWNLIPRKSMPPTRIARYCCEALKEGGGAGRFKMLGVRWAESARRKNSRGAVEVGALKRGKRTFVDPDNPDQQTLHYCMRHDTRHLNPIIDWSCDDVWEYIRKHKVPYCKLYDEGFTRLGCIGCPMADRAARDFARWPKFKDAYMRAFDRMIRKHEVAGKPLRRWKTAQDVMVWWMDRDLGATGDLSTVGLDEMEGELVNAFYER